ncbi:hypothetical protein ABC255_09500 [Neobacillus sp. 3P2-tot-E-2]|uniref:hypothetical protein n=1 Tax=Neobacillus sp. 3P2-tot-E-2 TaxID=3132212 RepID=UPI00399FC158
MSEDEKMINTLNTHYKFPCKVAFVLIKEHDGLIKSKATIDNVKFSNISKSTWTSEGSAVLSIKKLENATEYLLETAKLNEIWGFALSKK